MSDKKDRVQKEHVLAQIRTMKLTLRMTDIEICAALRISGATFYRYKQEIYKEDKQMLTEMVGNDIAHEIINAADSLNETIENMRKIASSSSATPLERIEAEKMKLRCCY